MCKENSTTWSNHVRLLCLKYGLPSPIQLLCQPPWSKKQWKDFISARVTAWHERELRLLATQNSKMTYLNVQTTGLSGRPHPALCNIINTLDVRRLRSHLKFLTKDLVPHVTMISPGPCKLCKNEYDDLHEHFLVSCGDAVLQEIRARLYPELVNIIVSVYPTCSILACSPSPKSLAQFILDCTSLNLPNNLRVPPNLPGLHGIFKVSRDWCFSVARELARHDQPF